MSAIWTTKSWKWQIITTLTPSLVRSAYLIRLAKNVSLIWVCTLMVSSTTSRVSSRTISRASKPVWNKWSIRERINVNQNQNYRRNCQKFCNLVRMPLLLARTAQKENVIKNNKKSLNNYLPASKLVRIRIKNNIHLRHYFRQTWDKKCKN